MTTLDIILMYGASWGWTSRARLGRAVRLDRLAEPGDGAALEPLEHLGVAPLTVPATGRDLTLDPPPLLGQARERIAATRDPEQRGPAEPKRRHPMDDLVRESLIFAPIGPAVIRGGRANPSGTLRDFPRTRPAGER
jgi:hypothetical protein